MFDGSDWDDSGEDDKEEQGEKKDVKEDRYKFNFASVVVPAEFKELATSHVLVYFHLLFRLALLLMTCISYCRSPSVSAIGGPSSWRRFTRHIAARTAVCRGAQVSARR